MAADPSSFDVRCTCGATIHSHDDHVGRTIRCRCGRALRIERPAGAEARTPLFSAGRRSPPNATPRQPAAPPSPDRSPRGSGRRSGSRSGRRGALRRALTGVGRALVNDLRQSSGLRRWATVASVAVFAGVSLSWLLLAWTSETFVPATLLAYGPRFVLLVPVALGALVSLMWARPSLVLYAASAAIVLGPVMGLRLHLLRGRGPVPPPDPGGVRVLTLNAQGGAVAARSMPALLREVRPDVVAVQECGDTLAAVLASETGMRPERHSNLCVLSRWPLSPPDSMPRAAFVRVSELGYGGTGLVVRYRVAHPRRPFDVVALHLETPRKGLERLLGSDGFIPDGGGLPRVGDLGGEQLNARIRRLESERASVWAARFADSVPLVVAGDFNMPVESTIFRRYWTVFDDAFERGGLGFGYTKFENRYIRARIDHVLFAPAWMTTAGAWVGPEVGSDHRPVIADLRFRQ